MLVDPGVNAGHAEGLARRDDALLQRLERLGEGVDLSPFHVLAVVSGQRLLPAQLGEDLLRSGVLQQLSVVVLLHGRRHRR